MTLPEPRFTATSGSPLRRVRSSVQIHFAMLDCMERKRRRNTKG